MAMNRKRISIAYCCLFLIVIALLSCTQFFDSALSYQNMSYSFRRKLASSDYGWAIGSFVSAQAEAKTADLRSELKEAETTYGFYRTTISSHIVALDENDGFAKLPCVFHDIALQDTCLVTLQDFCDGNTTDEGDMFRIPLRLMFTDAWCDIRVYQKAGTNGSSYISKDMADAIIANDESLGGYRDLLGLTYSIGDGVFTINNIYEPTVLLAPLLSRYYGKFIIVDSSVFMNHFGLAVTSLYKADSILQTDYVRYFQKHSSKVLGFTYCENGVLMDDQYTSYIQSAIANGYNTRLFEGPAFWISILMIIGYAVGLWFLCQSHLIMRQSFAVLIVCCSILLCVIGVIGLFFYNVVPLVNTFNVYVSAFSLFVIATLVLSPIIRSRKARRSLSVYETRI